MSRSSSTLSSATWMRSARSGSSLTAMMPRLVRGTRPKWIVSGIAEGAALRHLDRVDVTDQVAHRGVGCRELLAVALAAVLPVDRQQLALGVQQREAAGAHRRVRVVVDLATGDDGRPLVQQADERADEAGLALAALAEQHDVVAGEQRALDLGDHRVVEADDAGQGRLAGAEPANEVLADLGLHAAVHVPGGAKVTQSRDGGRCAHPNDATTRVVKRATSAAGRPVQTCRKIVAFHAFERRVVVRCRAVQVPRLDDGDAVVLPERGEGVRERHVRRARRQPVPLAQQVVEVAGAAAADQRAELAGAAVAVRRRRPGNRSCAARTRRRGRRPGWSPAASAAPAQG